MKGPPCDDQDIAIKSFFLGPRGENGAWFSALISSLLSRWLKWRRELYPEDGAAISSADQSQDDFRARQDLFANLAFELSRRFEREIPKFSPRYMGHMFSELSLPALVGHWIATLHNPNNLAIESAPVGVQIEREAIELLAEMIGFPPESVCGHFTSCGSIANYEALLRARDRGLDGTANRRAVVLVPESRHYSWVKGIHLMGLGSESLWPVSLDRFGTMSLPDLECRLEQAKRENRCAIAVISVLGTTELGNFDSIHRIQDLLDQQKSWAGEGIWHHVDAAYGGFFLSLRKSQESQFDERTLSALRAVHRATSVTIDPHKLGYVPYSCGAFLCRDRANYATKTFASPYIQFNENSDPGLFTLEGSRSASGAAATWLTLKAIGTGTEGYGRIPARTIQLRRELGQILGRSPASVQILPHLDSNILCFTVSGHGGKLSDANRWVEQFYSKYSHANAELFVSKTTLNLESYREMGADIFKVWQPVIDTNELELVRLTLMSPFLKSKEMNFHALEEFAKAVINF